MKYVQIIRQAGGIYEYYISPLSRTLTVSGNLALLCLAHLERIAIYWPGEVNGDGCRVILGNSILLYAKLASRCFLYGSSMLSRPSEQS